MMYRPTQPTLDSFPHLNQYIKYIEVLPDFRLNQYIHSYWMLSTCQPLYEDLTIRVIPDGCVNLIFNRDSRMKTELFGISTKPFYDRLTIQTHYFGVRFLPGQINRFFNMPLASLYNNNVMIAELLEKAYLELDEMLQEYSTFNKRIEIIESFLLHRLENNYQINHNFLNCLDIIYRSRGQITIKKLAEDINISTRYLRKLFMKEMGISPKEFTRIVRFQNSFKQTLSNPTSKQTHIALDNGYFDQAHFIKEFRKLYGTTPLRKADCDCVCSVFYNNS